MSRNRLLSFKSLFRGFVLLLWGRKKKRQRAFDQGPMTCRWSDLLDGFHVTGSSIIASHEPYYIAAIFFPSHCIGNVPRTFRYFSLPTYRQGSHARGALSAVSDMYHVVGTGGRDGLLGRFYPVRLRPASVRLLRELLLNIGKRPPPPPHTHTVTLRQGYGRTSSWPLVPRNVLDDHSLTKYRRGCGSTKIKPTASNPHVNQPNAVLPSSGTHNVARHHAFRPRMGNCPIGIYPSCPIPEMPLVALRRLAFDSQSPDCLRPPSVWAQGWPTLA